MPAAMIALSPDLERLIDERLDAVDRILSLSRTARSERMQILSDLESQIRDRLAARNSDEPTRADLLAVFSELDPPEAYLDEGMPVSPAFRASGLATGGNQRVAGDALEAGSSASRSEKGLLALWAGFLVSAGCLLAPSTLVVLIVSQSESFMTAYCILLQLLVLGGSFLAIINLAQSGQKSDLNRLISGACIAAIPCAIMAIFGVSGVWIGSESDFIGILSVYSLPGCAVTHGIWVAFFTARYLLKR